ncbi:hypothetical protein Tco_0377430 [Tanacetum coccineum]
MTTSKLPSLIGIRSILKGSSLSIVVGGLSALICIMPFLSKGMEVTVTCRDYLSGGLASVKLLVKIANLVAAHEISCSTLLLSGASLGWWFYQYLHVSGLLIPSCGITICNYSFLDGSPSPMAGASMLSPFGRHSLST